MLLVTSRSTGRWIIPKEWPIGGLEPHLSAAQEAYEEAGVTGAAFPDALGFYTYRKAIRASIRVEVFPLEITETLKQWPERGQRKRRWFSLSQASLAVSEPRLRVMIAGFGETCLAARAAAALPTRSLAAR